MGNRQTIKTTLAGGRNIAEVLAQWPQAAAVFTRLRMACVGCPMAAFETPAEAALAYGLDPDAVLAALDGVDEKQTFHLQVKGRDSKGNADRKRSHDT